LSNINFASAEAKYQQHLDDRKANKPPERPHLDELHRIGPQYRRRNRHADSPDFIDALGIRAAEFGNWVANDERPKIVNLAFDAFNGLARVLDAPPTAISLNGTLARGFGSRGQHFPAHYEPSRKVINIGKINGAGSLGHEWGHARDHWLGVGDEHISGERGGDECNLRNLETDHLAKPLAKAVVRLLRCLYYKPDLDAEYNPEVIRLRRANQRLQERLDAPWSRTITEARSRFTERHDMVRFSVRRVRTRLPLLGKRWLQSTPAANPAWRWMLHCCAAASSATVPLPPKGSSTMPPGGQPSLIIRSTKARGNVAV
jgi:hypothetical protein